MRIQQIEVGSYRVLNQFSLELDQQPGLDEKTYQIDLIVGINGTGKSTLMRLLAELFQRLATPNQSPLFSFTLKYTLLSGDNQTRTILISNKDELRQSLLTGEQALVVANPYYFQLDNGTAIPVPSIDPQYLPTYVVVFSSGNQEGWELREELGGEVGTGMSIPARGQDKEKQEILNLYKLEKAAEAAKNGDSQEAEPDITTPDAKRNDDRFIFVKNEQLPLIILCGLLADMHANGNSEGKGSILADALKETRIKVLHGFSLKIAINEATGSDYRLLIQLQELATYSVRYDTAGNKKLLFFELFTDQGFNKQCIQGLLALRGGLAVELFRALNRLRQSEDSTTEPVLQELHLFFDRLKNDADKESYDPDTLINIEKREPLHRLDWLSDGELSFLARLCLFSLLRDSEALVLLDEPEVHFNDYWKHQLISRIDHSLQNSYSHVIMTTHSSITLSDVIQNNIHVLKRYGTFTNQQAEPPNVRTLGTDPSDIIMHVFGAESATGAYSTEYIEERISSIRQIRDPQERSEEFTKLADQMGPGPLRYQIYRERLAADDEYNNKQEPKIHKG